MLIITKLFNLLKISHKEDATCVLLDLLISGTISAAACVPDYDMTEALGTEYWRGLTNEEVELVFRTGKPPKINWSGAVTLVDDWSIDLLPPVQNIGPSPDPVRRRWLLLKAGCSLDGQTSRHILRMQSTS